MDQIGTQHDLSVFELFCSSVEFRLLLPNDKLKYCLPLKPSSHETWQWHHSCDLMYRTLTYHQQIGPLAIDSHKLVVQMMIRGTIRIKSNHNTSLTEFSWKETSEALLNEGALLLAWVNFWCGRKRDYPQKTLGLGCDKLTLIPHPIGSLSSHDGYGRQNVTWELKIAQ